MVMTAKDMERIAMRYLMNPKALTFHEFGLYTNPEQPIRFDIIRIRLERHIIEGFEIKSSPADFKRDEKWHLYLPYVNKFYFIVPIEMIDMVKIDKIGIISIDDKYRVSIIKRAKLLNPLWETTLLGSRHYQRILELSLNRFRYIDSKNYFDY